LLEICIGLCNFEGLNFFPQLSNMNFTIAQQIKFPKDRCIFFSDDVEAFWSGGGLLKLNSGTGRSEILRDMLCEGISIQNQVNLRALTSC